MTNEQVTGKFINEFVKWGGLLMRVLKRRGNLKCHRRCRYVRKMRKGGRSWAGNKRVYVTNNDHHSQITS